LVPTEAARPLSFASPLACYSLMRVRFSFQERLPWRDDPMLESPFKTPDF
jgi:hypothetical protein